MNNKIKLAVAGAVLSAASIANAGIIIPAGDWTIDINGNVNAFATRLDVDKDDGALSGTIGTREDGNGEDSQYGMTTGLLPAWLGFTGTTRQNDVDVSFTISFQTGVADHGIHGDGTDGNGPNTTVASRQTFVTFGDKSWGTIKLGKDLGVFASNAILNDMTLLGVGAGGPTNGSNQNTTFGGIGTGFQYAAWKGQIAYTTPNMNGFQATVALVDPNMFTATSDATYQDRFGYEAQAQYSFTGDVSGKVWVGGASYDVTTASDFSANAAANGDSLTISAWDVGANVNVGNLGLTAYYYDGNGNGITAFGLEGVADMAASGAKKRDGDGGYVQATYVIPTGTKLGVAYGVSNLDKASGETNGSYGADVTGDLIDSQERWTVGAYHPLTKHLNLVAEYNNIEREGHNNVENEYDSYSIGAILFF
jgi:predicted porin